MSARFHCTRHERSLVCEAPAVTDDALRQAILDLGLEDDIPLWEIKDSCRAAGLIVDGTAGIEVLAGVLSNLARKDEIRTLVGHWNDPVPRCVGVDGAETLLADTRRHTSAKGIADDLELVCCGNVDNIVE